MSPTRPTRPRDARRAVVRNAALAGSTAARALRSDPLLFVLQVSRRAPGSVVRGAAARLARSSRPRWRALAAWLQERPEAVAAQVLASRSASRFAGELVVQAGRPDLLGVVLPHAPADLRARAAHAVGDLSRAADVAPPALAARYAGELAVLRGDVAPVAVGGGTRSPRRPRRAGDALAVLHVLTNSLPHTQSGYSLRSHAVLRAQREAGLEASAVTRLAYPVSVGRLGARDADVVDEVTYRRLLPWTLPPALPERLQRQTDLLDDVVTAVRPDVLHATTDHTNGLAAAAVARARGLPWVYEVRGLLEETWLARQPAELADDAARSERYRLWRERETATARAADHVVTLGRAMAGELVARGVPAERMTIVPNGVDAALLEQLVPAPDARRRLGLPEDGFWVGTLSSLVAYEGLDVLLAAVARLRAGGVDARALVVGDGVSRPALEHRASDLGLGGAVVFPGRVPRARAALYHQALDVFAVPRRDTPVCRLVTPLKPVEAMALGRPVVASDLPALAEVVAEPGSGRLAAAGDVDAWAAVLGDLAGDPAARDALGAAGRGFAAGRTWQRAGQTYLGLYRDLVEGA